MKAFQSGTRASVLLLLAATPLVIWGALSVPSNTADVTQWLPDGNTQKQQYDRFTKQFGADNFVLVSWPGCDLSDRRLDQFAAALRQATNQQNRRLVSRVVTARDVLLQLTEGQLKLSRRAAIRRMQGTLVGPDGNTSAMLVQLASAQRSDQHAVVDTIFATATDCGLQPEDLRLGGTAYKAVMIERISEQSLRTFVLPSCAIALLVAGICLKNLWYTLIVLAGAVFAELLSLAIVCVTGGEMNAVMIVMPPLIFVLTVSSAVHFINYYRDALRGRTPTEAAARAMRVAWLPIVLASGTTAIGLFSLGISALAPVRHFGLYAGLALLGSLFTVLIFLPAALSLIASKRQNGGSPSQRRELARHLLAGRRCDRIAVWLSQRYGFVMAACLAVVAMLGAGLSQLDTTVKLERSFADSSRFVRDYHWIEQNIGPLISVEVLLHFEDGCPLRTVDRMELMADIHRQVRRVDHVGGVLSPATFAPPVPRGAGPLQTARRSIVASKFDSARPELIDKRLVANQGGGEVWRLSARVPAMSDFGYSHFVPSLHQPISEIMQQRHDAGVTGVAVSYTGLSPLIDTAQHELLYDLIKSFGLACLLICPVMMLILRNFWGGLLSMIPNVTPVFCIFGMLGWLNIPVDIGAVLTASVALGIAVDDTLHFLTWYSRGLQSGLPRVAAVRHAYRHCATAMIQTTLICGLGILVFALSGYTPASRFGWLVAILLLAGLGGDLILLPAMLASPLGRAFQATQLSTAVGSWRRYFPDTALSAARALRQRID